MNKYESRILFLKNFTKELILNSQTEEHKEEISEKFEEQYQIFVPHKEEPIKSNFPSQIKTMEKPQQLQIFNKPETPARRLTVMSMPVTKPYTPQGFLPSIQTQQTAVRGIEEHGFGKLNVLLHDSRVTMIESPGPDKLVLARTGGRVVATKIKLNENDIREVIDYFSRQARIPVLSGLFKAAVGNLLITAVVSDLVGSRLSISKIMPMIPRRNF